MTDLEKVELAMRRAGEGLKRRSKNMSARILEETADELTKMATERKSLPLASAPIEDCGKCWENKRTLHSRWVCSGQCKIGMSGYLRKEDMLSARDGYVTTPWGLVDRGGVYKAT